MVEIILIFRRRLKSNIHHSSFPWCLIGLNNLSSKVSAGTWRTGTAAKNRQLQQQFVFVQLADSSVISSICQLSLWFVIYKEVEVKSTLHTQNLLLVPMNCQKKNNKPASKKPFLKVRCVLVSISLQTSYFVRNEIQVCSIWNCSWIFNISMFWE